MTQHDSTAESVARGLDHILTDLPTEVIVLHSPAGLVHFASHDSTKVFSGREPLVNSNLLERVHQDDQDRLRTMFTDAATRGKKIPPVTIRLVQPGREVIWVVLFTVAVKDGSGNVIELHTTLRDVTQQMALRDRIVEADTLAHMTNMIAKVGGWYADMQSGFMYWSDELKSIYEVENDFDPSRIDPNSDTRDDHLRAFFSAEDFKRIEEAAIEATSSGEPVVIEMPMTTAKNNARWIRLFLSASFENDVASRLYGATQDITEIKNREDEMEKLVRELTYQRDSLEEFGSLVSHQFRAPLTNLASITSLLQEVEDESEQRSLVNALGDAVEVLNRTLEEISQAVRVRQEVAPRDEVIHINDEIVSIKGQLAQSIRDAEATIHVDTTNLDVIEYPLIYLKSILRNLISNAIRFADESRPCEVWITTECVDDNPVLVVRDNGVGIDLDRHAERMFRLGKTFHRNASGRGVGLFMVRTIVESLGGTIEIDSEVDKGTTVHVNLRNHRAKEE